MLRALAVALVAVALAPSAGATETRGFAFGRTGGNIRPFRVVITTGGDVSATGAAQVGRLHLTRIQLGDLNRIAATTAFTKLPGSTRCEAALPDVATAYIRVGPRTVSVHGACVPAFQQLWTALARAVRLG